MSEENTEQPDKVQQLILNFIADDEGNVYMQAGFNPPIAEAVTPEQKSAASTLTILNNILADRGGEDVTKQ